jgi:hypothetical protein
VFGPRTRVVRRIVVAASQMMSRYLLVGGHTCSKLSKKYLLIYQLSEASPWVSRAHADCSRPPTARGVPR